MGALGLKVRPWGWVLVLIGWSRADSGSYGMLGWVCGF